MYWQTNNTTLTYNARYEQNEIEINSYSVEGELKYTKTEQFLEHAPWKVSVGIIFNWYSSILSMNSLHNNVWLHTLLKLAKLNELKVELCIHPAYSPDLGLSHYYYFSNYKEKRGGKIFGCY